MVRVDAVTFIRFAVQEGESGNEYYVPEVVYLY